MFSSSLLHKTASIGSWIKDEFRGDRSLGLVVQIDEMTNMMHVRFPKLGRTTWVVWKNHGHYKVIN